MRTKVSNLIDKFQESLTFRRHNFNIYHQFTMHRDMKRPLEENVCVIHVDFSENWNFKYTSEIQSMYFGASQNQATLHTGMLYLKKHAGVFQFNIYQ